MGGPELSKEEKRLERTTSKLTKEEKKKIDKAAAICGLPPVVLVRKKLFKGRFPERKVKVELLIVEAIDDATTIFSITAKVAQAGIRTGLFNSINGLPGFITASWLP